MLIFRTPKGVEAPIYTTDYSVHHSMGDFSTITVNYYETDENKFASSLIMPFAEIIDRGERYYMQSPKYNSESTPRQVTLTGIQIAKQIGWQRVDSKLHSSYKDDKLDLESCLNFIVGKTSKISFVREAMLDPDHTEDELDLNYSFTPHSYPDGFGGGRADELLKKLASDFGFEYRWHNYECIFAKKLGHKNSFFFIDRVNCTKIDYEENYSNITTRVKVYSNPETTVKKKVAASRKKTKESKKKSKAKRSRYKKERKKVTHRTKSTKNKKVTSKKKSTKKKTITGSKTTIKKKKTGPKYKLNYTYISPMVKKLGWPIVDAKTKYYKENFTKAELEEKAKSLVKDTPLVSWTITEPSLRQFSKHIRNRLYVGDQGLAKPMNYGKNIISRITAFTEYPADESKENQYTLGNMRTDPVLYQVNWKKEQQKLQDKYDDITTEVYTLSGSLDIMNETLDDYDVITHKLANWHAKSYQRLKKQGINIDKLLKAAPSVEVHKNSSSSKE